VLKKRIQLYEEKLTKIVPNVDGKDDSDMMETKEET
jgi:hypothetical protein